MKVIEKWYEKLLGYDWHYRLRSQFTFLELLFSIAAIVFVLWWLYDWLILGTV
jgi:hypothetical protein